MLKGKMVNLIKILSILLILIVLAFAPYLLRVYHLSILRDVLLWVGLSISWYFFSGLTKYIALGSVAFVGTGIYFTGLYMNLGWKGIYPILPFPVVVLLAGLINFALALAIGSVTLRIKGIYFAIVTFGAGEVVSGVIKWWQTQANVYQIFLPPGYRESQNVYFSVLITVVAVLLLTTFLRRSKFGLALRMIGENEDAAAHVGVNTNLFKILGFAIAAMCMGLIGGSYAIYFPTANVDTAFKLNYSFLPAVMAMLGGVGTFFGPIIGATALSLLSDYLSVTFPYNFLTILGVVLIVIVLFMPNGIMGVLQDLKVRLVGIKKLAKSPKKPP